MTTSTLTLLAAAVGTGGWLFRLGRRGRAVDDHPVCARCRFDLTGRPGGGGNCPECGTNLADRRAVAVGNRVRRPGLIYGGLSVAVAAAVPLACTLALTAGGLDPVRFTPTWLLIRSLSRATAADESRARAELILRVRRGSLSAGDEHRVVAIALARQANLAGRWNTAWGDTIEWLNARGRLPVADWNAYLAHVQPTTLNVVPQIHRGDPITFGVRGELRGATLLATSPPGLRTDCSAAVPGVSRAGILLPSWGGGFGSPFGLSGHVDLPPDAWPQLADGPQTLAVTVSGVDAGLAANSALYPPMTLTGSWTLAADGRGPVQRCRDDAVAKQVHDRMFGDIHTDASGAVYVSTRLDKPPVNLAFDVFVQYAGREWATDGPACIQSGQAVGLETVRVKGQGLKPGQWVRIVYRPNAAAAARMAKVDRMLDRELVVEPVNITAGP